MTNTPATCKSEYITMRDGIRLAVSIWLPNNDDRQDRRYTAVLSTTRYWRAMALQQDDPEAETFYSYARYLLTKGYVFVAVDARGSGASFGYRETEFSPAEVEDSGEIIEWVAEQHWCDGQVVTEGTSYTANTALYSLVTAPPALKVAVCRASDLDMLRHVFTPGGIANHWFIEAWGEATKAQDTNDINALFACGYWPIPEDGGANVLGVRPVDGDKEGALLTAAIAEHQHNFNVADKNNPWTFVDHKPFGSHRFLFEPEYKQRMENNPIPAVIHCGWHDAGAALGALSTFTSFNSPIRVVVGPWNHGGFFRADPFDDKAPDTITSDTVYGLTVKYFDAFTKNEKRASKTSENKGTDDLFRAVDYYTLGENRWKTTQQWPLPETTIQRLYLAEKNRLIESSPTLKEGGDNYLVDPTAATGLDNRWHAQARDKRILFPDRTDADKRLLVYDTPPLDSDTEITGHPVVHLYLRSNATDGQFFVYLETVDSDGRVRMLTEGQLRGLHRKVSNGTPPYKMFGPYHSLKEKDALPLVPGEIVGIAFDLFPISVLLKKGQRIRLAIAGADADVFAPIAGCESPEITVERNSVYASYIDLPIIP